MLQVRTTTRFRRDVKQVRKQGRDLQILQTVMNEIASGNALAPRFRDHVLRGNYKGRRECHLAPDWLLIYRTTQTEAVFERTGSHAELFK